MLGGDHRTDTHKPTEVGFFVPEIREYHASTLLIKPQL